MNAPDAALLEEVQALIERIRAFHEAQGRRIARHVKPGRKGRAGLERLERFGVPIPDDFRALYWHHDGIDPPLIYKRLWTFFGEFPWPTTKTLDIYNEGVRQRALPPPEGTLLAFMSPGLQEDPGLRGLTLYLDPRRAEDGKCPLVANQGSVASGYLIAFDSTLDMLRTVDAALTEDVIRFEDRIAVWSPAEFAHLVRRHNRRDEFWWRFAEGSLPMPTQITREEIARMSPSEQRLLQARFERGELSLHSAPPKSRTPPVEPSPTSESRPTTGKLRDEGIPIIRTDFTDEEGWQAVVEAIETSSEDDGSFEWIEDRSLEGLTAAQLMDRASSKWKGNPLSGLNGTGLAFVADATTMTSPRRPLLCMDLMWPRSFRLVPEVVGITHANLSLANLDFEDVLESLDQDSIFRGVR